MKQSTLTLDYTTYTASFDKLASYQLDKDYSTFTGNLWIHSKDELINIELAIGNYVHIDIGEFKFRLTFKNPYDYDDFLKLNEIGLSKFQITKFKFKDIKGIDNEPH